MKKGSVQVGERLLVFTQAASLSFPNLQSTEHRSRKHEGAVCRGSATALGVSHSCGPARRSLCPSLSWTRPSWSRHAGWTIPGPLLSLPSEDSHRIQSTVRLTTGKPPKSKPHNGLVNSFTKWVTPRLYLYTVVIDGQMCQRTTCY